MIPIGSLVWGKLPGYDWWPGCVVSYDKRSSGLDDNNESDEEEDITNEAAWVKWYGDNQLSQVNNFFLSAFFNYFLIIIVALSY